MSEKAKTLHIDRVFAQLNNLTLNNKPFKKHISDNIVSYTHPNLPGWSFQHQKNNNDGTIIDTYMLYHKNTGPFIQDTEKVSLFYEEMLSNTPLKYVIITNANGFRKNVPVKLVDIILDNQ